MLTLAVYLAELFWSLFVFPAQSPQVGCTQESLAPVSWPSLCLCREQRSHEEPERPRRAEGREEGARREQRARRERERKDGR